MGGGPDGRSPVFIPKGQMVAYSVWCLHRRRDLWGADAESFRPERWEGYNPPAWEFVPFNGGPRACLGRESLLFARQVSSKEYLMRLLANNSATNRAVCHDPD